MTDNTETQDTPDPFDAEMTVRVAALRVARRTLVGGAGVMMLAPDPVRVLEIARWIVDGETVPGVVAAVGRAQGPRFQDLNAATLQARPGSELVVLGTPYRCTHCQLTPTTCWNAPAKCCPDCDHVWRDVPKDMGL